MINTDRIKDPPIPLTEINKSGGCFFPCGYPVSPWHQVINRSLLFRIFNKAKRLLDVSVKFDAFLKRLLSRAVKNYEWRVILRGIIKSFESYLSGIFSLLKCFFYNNYSIINISHASLRQNKRNRNHTQNNYHAFRRPIRFFRSFLITFIYEL